MSRSSNLVAACGLALALIPAALAQPCTPEFSDRFATGEVGGTINRMLTFTDSQGGALIAGGSFTSAGGITANRIAMWRGERWEPMATGFNGAVHDMVIFDDGSGPAVYAAGAFTTSGPTSIARIARWNGSAWQPLGTGVNNTVRALAVYDIDGPGPMPASLYAGGDFTTAGGVTVARLARWDGAAWSPVSTGADASIEVMHVHDNGTGPALYLGGSFITAGGVTVNRIARFDQGGFSPVGTGTASTVRVLGSHDPDGPGGNPAQLIAGGDFTSIGGISANRIARWTGSQWLDMGAGLTSAPARVRVYNDGHGERLFVGGAFTSAGGISVDRLAKWDGAAWAPVSTPAANSNVNDFIPFDDGRGQRLFVGGALTSAGDATVGRIATWDGEVWAGLDRSFEAGVESIGVHQGNVIISGAFARADAQYANRIVRFDGEQFHPMGAGLSGPAHDMLSFDDGSGPALFIGGNFTNANGVTANRIVKWQGGVYSPVMVGTNNGVNGNINAFAVFNDGAGPALYAAGSFSSAGGVNATRIARWTGSGWATLGTGLNNTVNALAVYNDGTGEALYAGGQFTTAGGVAVGRLAKWDGSTWSDVAGGLNSTVNELRVYNGELYVGGQFTIAGATSVNRIARWNGSAWLDVASGVNNTVNTMTVHDEDGPSGAAPVLFVGGLFTQAGGMPADRLARWNGTTWSAIGAAGDGMNNTVNALASVASGNAAGLYIGGQFTLAAGVSSGRIARWGCPTQECYANCDGSTTTPVLNVADFSCFLTRFAAGDAYANCDGSTTTPVLNVADFGCFLQKYAVGCP